MKIDIPNSLYDRINKILKVSGCKNVEEFIIDNIREILVDYEKVHSSITLSEEDEKKIKERLEQLGYL